MDTALDQTTADDVITITDEDVLRMIDAEARQRLGISGEEFLARWKRRELPDTPATSDIGVLARWFDDP